MKKKQFASKVTRLTMSMVLGVSIIVPNMLPLYSQTVSANTQNTGILSAKDRVILYANSRTDFRDETIYFLITTRFYDGDSSNNARTSEDKKANNPESDPSWRGDFAGLIEQLDYIKALGFTAIWITPVVQNNSGYDYHGYHASNFNAVDYRYESNGVDYQTLIDAVHAKGMKIIQDVVFNHTSNFGEEGLNELGGSVGALKASGDIVLQQEHSFIFVMTPERLLHMMIGKPQIKIDFLFVDEAHKISDRGGRSTYYYKVIAQLSKMKEMPTVIFASPNIPNPEVYLSLIPKINIDEVKKLASKYTPVCQFKYFLDLCEGQAYFYNDYSKSLSSIGKIPQEDELSDIVNRVGSTQQNIIYCNSRQKVVDYAVQYASKLPIKDDEKLISLANDIRNEVHNDCYLADLIQRGVAYHVGYLPTNIRLRIEKSFVDGILRTIFCTSTLVEGVNLPADNLFITSYRNGNSNMDEVEFRNLVGRVGRIKYNLYGNVFLIRMEDRLKTQNYIDLLQNDVPKQEISINLIDNKKYLSLVVDDLARGDMELTKVREAATEKDFDALRKFAMIFTKDIAEDNITPIREAFSSLLNEESEYKIKENFPVEKTSDDINFSYDQIINLRELVESGQEYPKLTGENDEVDFQELVDFLMKLRKVFKWDIYEKRTIGKAGAYREDSVIRWYAVILLRWIRGNGLNQIIYHALKYKENNPNTGVVWIKPSKPMLRLAGLILYQSLKKRQPILMRT